MIPAKAALPFLCKVVRPTVIPIPVVNKVWVPLCVNSTDPLLVKTDPSAPVAPNILTTLPLISKSPLLFLRIEFVPLWLISRPSCAPGAPPNTAFALSPNIKSSTSWSNVIFTAAPAKTTSAPKFEAPSTSKISRFAVPSTSISALKSILPVIPSVDPSNVKLPESSSSPEVPAMTTLLSVKSPVSYTHLTLPTTPYV